MSIYLLMITLAIGVFVSVLLTHRDYLSAPVVICLSFFGATIMADIYSDVWLLDLSDNTAFVVAGGIYSFLIGYFVFYNKKKIEHLDFCRKIYSFKINKLFLITFFIVELIGVLGSYMYMNEVAAVVGITGDLSERIGAAHLVIMAQNPNYVLPEKPKIMIYLNEFAFVGTLFAIYIATYLFVIKKKISILAIFSIILYSINYIFVGSRYGIVSIIIACIVNYYIFVMKKNNWLINISFFQMIKYIVALIVCMFAFPLSLMMLGRSDNDLTVDAVGAIVQEACYSLAVYFGAEIKLLDIYLNNEFIVKNDNSPFLGHTFARVYDSLAKIFNETSWLNISTQDIPFNFVNGMFLGNVYTMFRPFLADVGYLGVVIFPFVMGSFFAIIYNNITSTGKFEKGINGYIILYSSLYYCIPLSVFGNAFFYQVNTAAVRYLFYYYVIDKFIIKTKESRK